MFAFAHHLLFLHAHMNPIRGYVWHMNPIRGYGWQMNPIRGYGWIHSLPIRGY